MENKYPFQRHEAIRAEARTWVLKFNRDTPPTKADIMALREWTERSPARRAELERAEEFWCDAEMLSVLAVPQGRDRDKIGAGSIGRFFTPLLQLNRASAMAALMFLGIAVGLLSWLYPVLGTAANGTYTTAIGEQKVLKLSDKSEIQIDTNSQIRIAYSDVRRQIYLLRGKAHFDVAKNSKRPFEVYAGGGMVRAVGTAFSVHLTQRDIKVTVDEGRVELVRVKPSAKEVLGIAPNNEIAPASGVTGSARQKETPDTREVFLSLDRGLSASFNHERETITKLAENELSRELAWRRGLLIFVGDPLSRIIAEVNRYTAARIEIIDPELNDLMLGGRFKVGELDALFDVLEAGFGIQVSYVDKDHVQLRASSP